MPDYLDSSHPSLGGRRLSPKSINEALRLAERILAEAGRHLRIALASEGLKVVEQPRWEVVPCTPEEMQRIVAHAQRQAGRYVP